MHRIQARIATTIVVAGLATVAKGQSVVINEVSYNPLGSDSVVLLEFIELHNAGVSSVNISGWELNFGPVPFVFPPATLMAPGAYLVVAENIASLQAATGHSAAFEFGGLGIGLSNGGDTILLRNGPVGATVIDSVGYDDDPPWPAAADGNGPTLELIHPSLDNALASSWAVSAGNNGTPGAQNSVFSAAPTVASESPRRLTSVNSLPSVVVTFSGAVSGVVASNLQVNGSSATAVSGAGAGPYTFSGYAVPAVGSVTIAMNAGSIVSVPGAVPFGGDSWTLSVGLVVVINEIHYHPADPNGDVEFLEIYNAGSNAANMTGWTMSDGIDLVVPSLPPLAPGAFRVIARDPARLQTVTGYSGAIAWEAGDALSNGGERLALSDASGNEIDVVSYSDGGNWAAAADGDGPSLELLNPGLPNQLGQAWRASLVTHGTPGAQNSVYQPVLGPLVVGVSHSPIIPAPSQSLTVTAVVLDDSASPTATLYYRQDANPTVAYSSTAMLDDGLHGDGAAGDGLYGAVIPGLANGARMDFAIRASDGVNTTASPSGHNTLATGANPVQTYLCKFSSDAPITDLPTFHLITTQFTRTQQDNHDEVEHDATFVSCDIAGACTNYYNVTERYRGQSSLGQHPHSFRVDFPTDRPYPSELGFAMTRMNLMSQSVDKQFLGYQFFREVFGGFLPTPRTQLVHLNTNPLSHGGTQNFVYINAERVDGDFLQSQAGDVIPTRFPDRCSGNSEVCEASTDCPVGQSCLRTDNGNLYRGRLSGALDYRGESVGSYSSSGYDKETNEEDAIWTDLRDLSRALDPTQTPDPVYESTVDGVVDVDNWARWLAVHMLLVNQEGGIYRDTGDDYYVYLELAGSPGGYNAKFIPWDIDSVFGGFAGSFAQETIWRTTVPAVQRFERSNAFGGRFVRAICEMLGNEFAIATMNAKIDALPTSVADASRKTALKNWVAARHTFVNNELIDQTTITGVPSSPYINANPVISLSGQLNQCGAHSVTLNGIPATFSLFGGTWAQNLTLFPGVNNIVVRSLDEHGLEIDRAEASVTYSPPGGILRLTMPTRMVADKTLTLKAELLDTFGKVDWTKWTLLGSVSARRVSDGTPVPTSITVFESNTGGVGGGVPPADSIRFYNGIGSVSITLDDPASVAGQAIEVLVTADSRTASKVVQVLPNVPATFRNLSGTLTGANLTWSPSDGVVHLTGNVTVNGGSTLTIQPGTLVMVDQGPSGSGTIIQMNGNMSCVGTEALPIFFFPTSGPPAMVLPQTTQNNPPSWRGIWHQGSGSSTYRYMFLTGAGNGPIDGHPRPPVMRYQDSHSSTMTDCVFADAPGKIVHVAGSGTFNVLRCLFSRVGIGGEYLGANHRLTMEDCWYTRTGRASEPDNADGDAIHLDNASSIQNLRRCILADSGDDGIDHNASNPVVEDSIIWDVEDKAASLTGGSITFDNVLVFDCGTGIRGNGITTYTTIAVGSPISIPNTVSRTIIYPSSLDTCLRRCSIADTPCTLDAECPLGETCSATATIGSVGYTLVGSAGDLGCGTANFSANPLFVNAGARDYDLQAASPAVAAGPSGERIGWLGFPIGQPCNDNGDCNDSNVCTNDSCSLGACRFVPIGGCIPCSTSADCVSSNPCLAGTCQVNGTCSFGPGNNGASCNDSIACTVADTCLNGSCAGSASCPQGQICDLQSGLCENVPTVLEFQEGGDSYTGTEDTYLHSAQVTTNFGASETLRWDTSDGSPAGPVYLLLRFNNIFGPSALQIPVGATIVQAKLAYTVGGDANAAGNLGNLHDVLVDWTEATTFSTFGGDSGVQTDEYTSTAVSSMPGSPIGEYEVDVTSNLQAWSNNPALNRGWIVIPTNTDGVQVRSSEYVAAPGERPRLTVEFFGGGCLSNADCNDGNPCTDDLCTGGGCVHDSVQGCCLTNADCEDGNVCTTNTCNTGNNTCAFANNTLPCDDGSACTANDACAGGSCVSGSALICNDGNVCTSDSCDVSLGCVFTPNAIACSDGAACTISDTCSNGTCVGMNNCPIGETCNVALGICESQVAYVFQNGTAGYTGTQDTFVQQASPATVNGAAEVWEWDAQDGTGPNLAMIRFDSLFVGSGGPIPVGAQVLSATLTYTIGGPDSPVGNGGQLHRIDAGLSWDEGTANYNNFGGDAGVQADEYLASFVVAPGTPAGPVNLDVTADVQAWALLPASNKGWVVIPTDNDGVQVRSSEYTGAVAERPKLTVVVGTSSPQAPPLPLLAGDTWSYWKGTAEPTPGDLTAWTQRTFDDSAWLTGPSGFGYGTDCDPYGTVLSDMLNGYRSVYVRHEFSIANPGNMQELTLTVDFDDAFVAYVNGTRVFGTNVTGTPPLFNTLATADHECSSGSPANAPTVVPIHASFDLATLLVAGDNVLAIQAHNLTDGSSDFTLLPTMVGVENAAPDPPTVSAIGPRYLSITPPPGHTSMAIQVDASGMGCMPQYVTVGGLLSASPVFQSSAAWGTVVVADREITPSTVYSVRADARAPSDPPNLSAAATATTWGWGDVNNVDAVNLFDIVCVLDGFQDIFANCTPEGVDLQGNVPNQDVDLFDIVAVLDAFQALPYPDGTPCAAASNVAGQSLPDRAILRLSTEAARVRPGADVAVDVFGDGLAALRGYQLALDMIDSGGRPIRALDVVVDERHADYVFADQQSYWAGDANRRRLANAASLEVAPLETGAYLGTFWFRAPRDGGGVLRAVIRADETVLLDGSGRSLRVDGDLEVKIEVVTEKPAIRPSPRTGSR